MSLFKDKNVVITGGTDGIGAAAALEFCSNGACVIIIGRSEEKARKLIEKSKVLPGSISYIIRDFSLLKTAAETADIVASRLNRIDIIIHSVGILITKTEHTSEGLEKDFATGFLSRYVFTEKLFSLSLLVPATIMINISASGPKVPFFAQMEFKDKEMVMARTGMKSHGQTQLANDLYSVIAAKRYGIISIGYGPGSVDTKIRREVPQLIQLIMKPLFYFTTRKAQEVSKQFIDILSTNKFESGNHYFFNRNGFFKAASFIVQEIRQADLMSISKELSEIVLRENGIQL